MKNIYLPGTNKHVGYIFGETMHVYKKYIKYLPIDMNKDYKWFGLEIGPKFIIEEDEKKYVELVQCIGRYYKIEVKMYTFFECIFRTPDNLDVIEMTYLYKYWNKKHGTLPKSN